MTPGRHCNNEVILYIEKADIPQAGQSWDTLNSSKIPGGIISLVQST